MNESKSGRPADGTGPKARVKVLVLTLERARARQQRIAKLLNDADIPFEFFYGVDGRRDPNPIMPFYDRQLRIAHKGKELSAGQLGCFGSHYLIWRRCVADNTPFIILEDDVSFEPHLLRQFIALCDAFPDEAGCIRLFENKTRNHKAYSLARVGPFQLIRYTKGPMSAMGYFLRPQAAQRFIDQVNPVFLPVDIYMDRYWVNKVLCCGITPPIVLHENHFESMIGYDREKRKRSLIENFRREKFMLMERWKRFVFNRRPPNR